MHGYMLMVTVLSCIMDVTVSLDKPVLRRMAVIENKGISNTTEQIHIQIHTSSTPKPEAPRLDSMHEEDRVRVRKGVSSSSVVNFKRRGRGPRRKNAYPSNWGTFSLFCKTGWLLQILPNGVVNGTRNTNSPYALVQIQVLTPTLVRFKGVVSGRYVGVNSKGRLVSKKYPTKETLFQEEVLENSYRTFNSSVHPKVGTSSWYMGIRKNGSPKKASRTKVSVSGGSYNGYLLDHINVPFRKVSAVWRLGGNICSLFEGVQYFADMCVSVYRGSTVNQKTWLVKLGTEARRY